MREILLQVYTLVLTSTQFINGINQEFLKFINNNYQRDLLDDEYSRLRLFEVLVMDEGFFVCPEVMLPMLKDLPSTVLHCCRLINIHDDTVTITKKGKEQLEYSKKCRGIT